MYGENYGYKTSISKLMVKHLKKKFIRIKNSNLLKKNSNILDIGCNDGTFLNFFSKNDLNLNILGIDPSSINFIDNYKNKINLITEFFSKQSVLKNLRTKNKKFKLITSFAVFYDIEDPNSFCKDINCLLEKNGKWIIELSYFPLLLKNLTYDQICHEHVMYYSLSSIKKILNKNNLKILDFEINFINGGSIEISCAKKISNFKSNIKKINSLLKMEKNINSESFKKFRLRVDASKKNLKNFLDEEKSIIGYGASTKGNVILNFSKITKKNLNYICDENYFKHNKYSPGSNIKIISKNMMRKLNPKYLLILIWSFRKEVIQQEKKYIMNGGKLVFPLPIFHVVDKLNYLNYLNSEYDIFQFSE